MIIDGNSLIRLKKLPENILIKYFLMMVRDLFARQLGAEKSIGKYVAYIDSDTELPDEKIH